MKSRQQVNSVCQLNKTTSDKCKPTRTTRPYTTRDWVEISNPIGTFIKIGFDFFFKNKKEKINLQISRSHSIAQKQKYINHTTLHNVAIQLILMQQFQDIG